MKNDRIAKLAPFIGQDITVDYTWVGIEKTASGMLLSANTEKVVVDRPFNFSFLGRKTISFKSKSTEIKQIMTAEGEVVYTN